MPRPLTPEDLFAIRLPEEPQISPDGARVAYVVMEIEGAAYAYRRAIWVAPAGGGEPRQFTAGPRDSAPRWSPDGARLAFLRAPAEGTKPSSREERDRGVGKPQLWVMPADGGEARQVTFLRHGAGAPAWSPDGVTLLFAAPTGEYDDPAVDDAALDGKTLPRVRTITHLWHRNDGHGYTYELRSHLFAVPAAGGEPRQLTDGDWDDHEPSWAPDGARVAFVSDRSGERWRWPGGQVWTLDLVSGATARLTDEALGCGVPTWSPDGEQIAFLAAPVRGGSGHTDLYVVPPDPARGPARCLSQDFIPVCQDRCIDDLRNDHMGDHLYWSADSREVFFLGSMRGETQIYAARPGEDGHPRQITSGRRHTYGFSLAARPGVLALAVSEPALPGDVVVQPLDGASGAEAAPRRLTRLNEALLAEVEIAPMEEFAFKGADGWDLQGWVVRPAHAAPDALLPTILEIHGGPAYMYGYSFFFEFQLLAARGYAVVLSNPRGGAGYGRDFMHAVLHDWGGNDYADVMAGLDAALARGGLDAERLGVAGGSYGGYMTNWIVGHTDRFKAAVTMRSVVNIASFFGTSDAGWWLAVDEIGAVPWEDLDKLMRHSPITYVANIHTPLLILHSDQDLRCPIGEGEQLFSALAYLGRDVKLVRFEGQSHGLSRTGHPRSRLIRLREIAGWFERYIPTHAAVPAAVEAAR